jgi:ABC-type transporter MlaC component
MTDRTRREHTVKRIAIIGAVVVAFAAAPTVAAAGNVSAQVKPQTSAQVISVKTSKVRRAQAAVSVQRQLVQVAQSKRIAIVLHGQLR